MISYECQVSAGNSGVIGAESSLQDQRKLKSISAQRCEEAGEVRISRAQQHGWPIKLSVFNVDATKFVAEDSQVFGYVVTTGRHIARVVVGSECQAISQFDQFAVFMGRKISLQTQSDAIEFGKFERFGQTVKQLNLVGLGSN